MEASLLRCLLVFLTLGRFAYADITFQDLTPKMFNGSDADLAGVNLTAFGITCAGGNAYSGEQSIISWENKSGRKPHANGTYDRIKTYRINFQIRNRKGAVTHKEQFTYVHDKYSHDQAHVTHDSLKCARSFVRLKNPVDLTYAHIEYWIDRIEWTAEELPKHTDDRVAFSLEETLDEYRNSAKSKRESKQSFVVKFKRPPTSIASFQISSGLTGYLFPRGDYTSFVKTDEPWNSAIRQYCQSSHSCDAGYETSIDSGDNIKSPDLTKACKRYGCLAVIIDKYSYPAADAHAGLGGSSRSPCKKIRKEILVELCNDSGGLFSKESCKEPTIRCSQIFPSAYGRTPQKGSEGLAVVSWRPAYPMTAKRVKVHVKGNTHQVALTED